ncbi:MAG: hypothetical protein HY509_00505 [Acidobacteria bacterium]|nr:hypothetical protein [Acidobacteriota bacterium]
MSEESKTLPSESDPEYHPYLKQLSKKKSPTTASSTVRYVGMLALIGFLVGGWLFLVYREPPPPAAASRAGISGAAGLPVRTPAPEEILNNPEFQAAVKMSEEQMELDRIAKRFIQVEDYRWKKLGWRVEKIRDVGRGIALGKDVEASQEVTGKVMETQVMADDANGLWDVGVQYARLLGVKEGDPDYIHKVALIAAYVNNENLLIEYEKYANKEFNPHLVAPGTLVRFRPLDDTLLEILFTNWREVIDRQG